MLPLQTERLTLRPFTVEDAPFILRLLNEPSFIANIVDKGVRTEAAAADYLRQGPMASYAEHGFGLWLVADRATGVAMGMCGLIRRATLPEVDLGYAFVPEYWGRGLAREAAAACLAYGRDVLGLRALLAIVTPGNAPSIRLLEALGFAANGRMAFEPGDEVLVFRTVFTTIRKARASDAPQLAALAERTFRDAFEAVNTPEDMALHCGASYSPAILDREIRDPGVTTLVAEHQGQLVAYAQTRWDPPPACVQAERPFEIQRLYVSSAFHGKGLAQELMAACLELAGAGGADRVWLGVWEHNPRAIAFYRKSGFVEVGDHGFLLGTDPQRDIVMVRPVAPAGID